MDWNGRVTGDFSPQIVLFGAFTAASNDTWLYKPLIEKSK